jgi:hypothetical protein
MIDTLVLGALVLASENRGRKLLDAAAANWTKVEARAVPRYDRAAASECPWLRQGRLAMGPLRRALRRAYRRTG